MKNLRYICVQPAIPYFAWQAEVMLNNFIDNGINPENIHIVSGVTSTIDSSWVKLKQKFPKVWFFFYKDSRLNKIYTPSIVPHLLKKHFFEHTYLKDEAIFQHDVDIIFTKKVDWSKYLHDDIWYLSDTTAYIGADYIKSKKYGIFEEMCKIVGLDENIPVINQERSGGAQYIMKNVDWQYWEKVEKDSNSLYSFFQQHLHKYPSTNTYHPIQMWTAGMWAQLWNAWYFCHQTQVIDEMNFLWPHENISMWEKYSIFHNSGVLSTSPTTTFSKTKYTLTLPYNIKIEDFNPSICSYKYVEEIIRTSKNSCLL